MDEHVCYFHVLLYKCNVKVKIFGKHVLTNLCESSLKSFPRSAVFEIKDMHIQFYEVLPHGSPECTVTCTLHRALSSCSLVSSSWF